MTSLKDRKNRTPSVLPGLHEIGGWFVVLQAAILVLLILKDFLR